MQIKSFKINSFYWSPLLLLLFLSGCQSSDPMAMIPSNQRIMMMAESQQGNTIQTNKTGISVNNMLAQVKQQYKNEKPTTTTPDYYLRFAYQPEQQDLSPPQWQQLKAVLAQLSNPKQYQARIQLSDIPGESSDTMTEQYARATKIQAFLIPQLGHADIQLVPGLPAQSLEIQLAGLHSEESGKGV